MRCRFAGGVRSLLRLSEYSRYLVFGVDLGQTGVGRDELRQVGLIGRWNSFLQQRASENC